MYSYIHLFLLNDHAFFSLGTSERTRAFGTFPGNYVAPVWPPPNSYLPTATWTQKSPPNCLHSLQQTLLWHSNVSPSHLPTTLLHLVQSHLHVFPGQRWRQGHQVVSHPHHPACVCACVCVFHWDLSVFTHTHTTQGERMNADDTVSDAKKGLFCSTTICSCRKFSFPHTEQLNDSYKAFIQYDAAFSFLSITLPSQKTTLQGTFD